MTAHIGSSQVQAFKGGGREGCSGSIVLKVLGLTRLQGLTDNKDTMLARAD